MTSVRVVNEQSVLLPCSCGDRSIDFPAKGLKTKKKKSVCLAKSTLRLEKRVEKGDNSVVLSLLLAEARAGPLLPDLEG